MLKKYYFGAVLLPLIMAGCGSSSSNTVYVGKGYYIDSPVSGVSYECGSEQGVTDKDGLFKYDLGKDCQFYFGNSIFKTVSGDKLKKAKTIIYEKDVKVARFLQILDNDGDATNGIEITKEVIEHIPESAYKYDDEGMNQLFTALNKDVANYNGRLVTKEEAKSHIDSESGGVESKNSPKFTISPKAPKYDDLITLDASESQGDIESYSWSVDGLSNSKKIFKVSTLKEGDYSVVLTIKYKDGKTKSSTKSLYIAPPPTEWTGVSPIESDSNSKLYIRTDKSYIYLKLESDRNLSKAQFFIDSDANKISGMYTDSYSGSGFDYVLENDGFYELIHRGDFSSKLVQSMNYNIDSDVLEVEIDKSKFDYLAKDFGVMVFFLGSSEYNLPKSGSIKKFTDINFNANQVDKVPPVITVAKPSMVASESNYTKPNFATAYDVFDEKSVTVSVDDSKVDKTKNGYYSVIYTATDKANNISKKSTIVQIVGATSSSKLELKELGEMDDDVVVDHQSGLVWSNDNTLIKENEVSTRGCYFMGSGISDSDAKSALNNFCEQSNYAGFTNWRVPTPLELSKFTFRMQQEGNEPGMGKHGCVNVIAIDENNNTKAVWTRKYKVDEKDKIFAGFIDDGFNFPAGGRCVRGEIDGDNGGFEVELNATFTSAKVLKDTKKKLMWVNEFNPANNACLAIHFDIPEELNASKDFCQKLNYSGYTNWRTPTSVELSNFVIKTNEAHIFTGYEATCKRLLAKDDDNISRAVYTRFDTNATHALGGIADLEENLTSNIGLRCVRDN